MHLTINPSTFNKYCNNKLLYMIVAPYQNKTLYRKKCLQYKFYGFIDVFAHKQKPSEVN